MRIPQKERMTPNLRFCVIITIMITIGQYDITCDRGPGSDLLRVFLEKTDVDLVIVKRHLRRGLMVY